MSKLFIILQKDTDEETPQTLAHAFTDLHEAREHALNQLKEDYPDAPIVETEADLEDAFDDDTDFVICEEELAVYFDKYSAATRYYIDYVNTIDGNDIDKLGLAEI